VTSQAGGFRRLPGPLDERGRVTAELAFGSLFAACLLAAIAWASSVLLLLGGCQSAVAEVARQEARGDSAAVARAIAAAPEGAEFSTSRAGGMVTVQVDLTAQPWAGWLPAIPLQARASVLEEE
jgi:hypothetical protein